MKSSRYALHTTIYALRTFIYSHYPSLYALHTTVRVITTFPSLYAIHYSLLTYYHYFPSITNIFIDTRHPSYAIRSSLHALQGTLHSIINLFPATRNPKLCIHYYYPLSCYSHYIPCFTPSIQCPSDREIHMWANRYWAQDCTYVLGKGCSGGTFTAELRSLRKNLPLPRQSNIARFNPFLEVGLIRLGGRLQCANLIREQQHPLLLVGAHRFTELHILQTHLRLQNFGLRIILSQLRSESWILSIWVFTSAVTLAVIDW
jgi:hypothetical protein